MLSSGLEIDAVVVVTQREMTGPVAFDCLKAGKHVITEKPMASTYEQGKKLVDLAEENGRIYSVGYMRRHDLGVKKGKELFDAFQESSDLGKLNYIRIHCFDSNPYCNEDDYIQTDEDITEQDELIEKEIADGTIPDPADMMLDPEGSGGLRPMPFPEEEPGVDTADADLRSTAVDSAVTKSNINQTPKGGEI